MKHQSIQLILITGFFIAVFLRVYTWLISIIGGPEELRLGLVYISIVVLPIGIYLGLKRIQYIRSKVNDFLRSLIYGTSIGVAAGIFLVLTKVFILLALEQNVEGTGEYLVSIAPLLSLAWYSGLGLIYSSVIHFIVQRQFKKP